MKRTGSVAKDTRVMVKKEVEEEENGRERKRARLTREKISEKCLTSVEIQGAVNNSETNGELPSNHLNVHFSDAQTSTPIPQNGPASGNSAVDDMPTSSSLPLCPSISDIVLSTSVSNINTATVDTSDTELPVNSLFSSEQENREENLCPNKEENDVNEKDEASKQNFVAESNDIQVDDGEVSRIQKNKDIETKDHAWKYDIECFTSSLLMVTPLEGHADNILSVVADGDIILSASSDTTIKMWDAVSKKEMCNFQGHSGTVTTVVLLTPKQSAALAHKMNFSNISRIVISASIDCSVRLWAVPSGVELSSFYTYNGITCLEYLESDHQVVIGTEGGKLELWDLCSSKVVDSVLAHENAVTCLKVDDCYIYTTSDDGMIKVWLLEENELNGIYTRRRKQQSSERNSHLEPTMWKCLSFHNGLIYLGDNTSNLKILDWKEGRLREIKNPTHQSGVVDAVFIKDDVLLSSYYDPVNLGRINVWQLPSMTYICTLSGDVCKLSSLAFTTAEDKVLRIVSGGERLLVWDFICGQPASKEINAKYQCQEIEQPDEDDDEEEEEIVSKSPCSKASKSSESSQDMKSKRSSWPCIVM